MSDESNNHIRKIIHVDMDAFYAAVEQRDFPEYRGKPVVVGGSPKSRGVVATASYEARKYGIHSAMPTSLAYRKCPQALFVNARFDVYKEVSRQIREVFIEYTDLVEPLSLDEAYLDVTENKPEIESATLIARQIKQKIKERTQLTASAGVSHNKFLAKIASDMHKPDGLTLILPEKAEEFIETLPVGKIHGIGKATETKMHKMGIYTGGDLRKRTENELREQFGKVASYYYSIARGIDYREVKPSRVRKSVGAERTFAVDISEIEDIHFQLNRIAGMVQERLEKLPTKGKTITLKVRYANFESVSRSVTLPDSVCDSATLYQTSLELLKETEAGDRSVRLLGISVSNLDLHDPEKEYGVQLYLFDEQQ